MTCTRIVKTIALLVALAPACAAGAVAPASALADAGGAATPGADTGSPPAATGSGGSPSAGSPQAASPVPAVVVAGGAVTLRTAASTLLGSTLDFRGRTSPHNAGLTVLVERFDAQRGAWVAATRTVVDRRGGFLARWRTNLAGRIPVRAVVTGVARAARRGRTGTSQSSSAAQVTIYRPALATWFGPGFYGKTTACGEQMTPSLVGVAHRTLPCGTLVDVSYNGEHLAVPVVDRGPYANGADWDLTAGAASALGVTETVRIGTIVVGRAAATPPPAAPPASGSSPSQSSGTTGGTAAGG
jgi:rare lipoprotein A (peptidoglycan hydrolase)